MSLPALQKQYQLTPAAAESRLRIIDAPVAAPTEEQIVVRMRACSLNRRDLMIARGVYPTGRSSGIVPLSDGAGEVVA
ncbi:MAG: hypothetical protein NZM12_05665, partial [Steroidobacteraceae bacterium]|nr:hypothetical protein [Steroidobacteraceae bacterium]MDW8259885.1 NAD(P)-dependent alcohol dehydrogenase [Gammaproteobacteria bacterium]